jgi:anti-sigma regulatory factor (Ser/Thr protein kinase)
MGFTIMQAFMDDFSLESEKGGGTRVQMMKKLGMEYAAGERLAEETLHA